MNQLTINDIILTVMEQSEILEDCGLRAEYIVLSPKAYDMLDDEYQREFGKRLDGESTILGLKIFFDAEIPDWFVRVVGSINY